MEVKHDLLTSKYTKVYCEDKEHQKFNAPHHFIVGLADSPENTITPICEVNFQEGPIKENMQLITSVKTQYFERIENIISNAIRNGATYTEVSEQIAKQTGLSLNRSRLIARDQIGTLNGQITKQRQTSAGITKYRWSTSKDERVRQIHKVREGKIFDWDKPPFDGHPGMPISCRCVAIPIIDNKVR